MKIADIHNGYDFDAYDEQEFRKAFYKGTDAAWRTYERRPMTSWKPSTGKK